MNMSRNEDSTTVFFGFVLFVFSVCYNLIVISLASLVSVASHPALWTSRAAESQRHIFI